MIKKFKYWLRLNIDTWGSYEKGDVDVFYMYLNNDQCGLARFSIDKHWDIVRCVQFTGLKDSVGEDVYAGDILYSELYGVGYVIWDNDKSCYSVCVEKPNEEKEYYFVLSYGNVIGNIYQNSELLTKLN